MRKAEIKLILSLSLLKQEQVTGISADNDSLVRNPGMAKIVVCLHLLEV